MDTIKEQLPQNQSDSDSEWTLLSPPSSSFERDVHSFEDLDSSSESESSSTSPSPAANEPDDGLIEVNLNDDRQTNPITLPRRHIVIHQAREETSPTTRQDVDERPSSASEPIMAGFQALDTTNSEDDDDADGEASRKSSSSQSEFGEYVDLGKRENALSSIESTVAKFPSYSPADVESKVLESGNQAVCKLESTRAQLDELSKTVERTSRRNRSILRLSQLYTNTTLCMMLAYGLFLCVAIYSYIENRPHIKQSSSAASSKLPKFVADTLKNFNFLSDSIPYGRQYEELQELDSELHQCIKRQSPSSFKYYMSKEDQQDNNARQQKGAKSLKPYRGLVCYGQEKQWRQRFDKLKFEHKLDLHNLMHEAKKRVINDMLEFHHPSLKFKLILNQLEYLDFLEKKRNRKQTEEVIKHLKAENLQLLNRLNRPDETGYQKLVVNLELQNSKLKRENEVLKSNLRGRAGPAYMKQSHELEQYERENVMLKEFHYHVAQEVSKSLKQFNLYTIDASTVLDDPDSLNAQLILTKSHLSRLSEKISTTLIENEALKEELKEAYISNTGGQSSTNMLSVQRDTQHPDYHIANISSDNGDSHALSTDSCLRNLMETREKSYRLGMELDRVKRRCRDIGHESNQRSEQCPSADRHLTRAERNESSVGKLGQQTALDRSRNALSIIKNEQMVDELLGFLTKFNDQIELTNELAFVENQSIEPVKTASEQLGIEGGESSAAKVIPIYIREAIRGESRDNTKQYGGDTQVSTLAPSSLSLPPASSSDAVNETGSQQLYDEHAQVDDEQQNQSLANAGEMDVKYVPPPTARDTWFFKRAKQRRQLRNNQKSSGVWKKRTAHGDWLSKRAKLREKLRRASSYVEHYDHYIANKYLDCNNKPQRPRSSGKQRKRCKPTKKHNDDTRFLRDEL